VAGALLLGVTKGLQNDQGHNFESVSQSLALGKTCTNTLHLQLDGMVEQYLKMFYEYLPSTIMPANM
jgi:hypothetical protein